MKRGQVTIFVVIGLVALLVVGLAYLALQSNEPSTLTAKQEATAITNLVQQCLNEVGRESIRLTALQGGYYSTANLDRTPDNAQVVFLEPQTIPLWHEIHECQENELGCIGDNRPLLCDRKEKYCPISIEGGNKDVSFQDSIERFAEDEFTSCLNDFRSLPHILVDVQSDPEIQAIIREEDVLLDLEYDLELTTTDNEIVDLKEFSTTLNVNLPQLYELATEIYATERNNNVIEELFLHLLTIYSGLDSDIPPIRDAQLHGGPKFWVTRNVQETIENDLMPFMNFIQVVNAMESYAPIESPNVDDKYQPYVSGLYDYMSIKLGPKAYPLGVQFQNPYEGFNLDINGEEFLKGNELPGIGFLRSISGLTFIQYKFKYTVDFPMVVKITDPYAFNGAGLDLYYGLEANIRKNNVLNTSKDILTFYGADTTLDLASPEQLVNHNFNVKVTDKRTGDGIDAAGITYVCGPEFNMGATDESGVWSGKLPYCLAGGFLKIETLDFLSSSTSLENFEEDGLSTDVELALWPRTNKRVVMYKRNPETGGTPQPLSENETVILTITRHKETPHDGESPQQGIIEFGTRNTETEKNNTIILMQTALENGDISQDDYDAVIADMSQREVERLDVQIVDLVPGTYDLTGFLTYYGLIQIPEKQECKSVMGGLKNECAVYPGQNFSSWQEGGVVLTEGDAVEFTEAFVYSDNPLTLYVLAQPIPRDWDMLQEYQPLEDYQTYERKALVQPKFS